MMGRSTMSAAVTFVAALACGLIAVGNGFAEDQVAVSSWPGFRGAGDSHSHAARLPISWEMRGRRNGSWTIRLPGYGQSSPVVWGNRAFITAVSGDQKEHLHLLAIQLADGTVAWKQDFSGTQRIPDGDAVSRGAPTPVVDGQRIYAVFESGDIVAVSLDGEVQWQRSFVKDYGEIKGPHGYSSSPVLAEGLVILQVAHSGPSYMLALDQATGETRWKVEHPSQTGWSSPVVYQHDGVTAVVASTAGSVRAFDVRNGEELWFVTNVQGNSTASPTVIGDRILIAAGGDRDSGGSRRGRPESSSTGAAPETSPSGSAKSEDPAATSTRPAPTEARTSTEPKPSAESPSNAPTGSSPNRPAEGDVPSRGGRAPFDPAKAGSLLIRLGGHGDVTESHVVWKAAKVSAGYASPVIANNLAFFVNRVGGVQCVDLETGEVRWQHRLPGSAWASPVLSDGHVFFFCKDGAVVVLKASDTLEEVGESALSATDVVYGVAAIDGAWLIRTGRGLVKVAGE
jgi:outer membrane protein assembly factor BamB